MEKRKIFLTYQEQEKVLLNIIAQGEYQQLPQMVKNGYPLSMTVLETLRWSRQTSLIIRLLKKEFAYVGDNAALFDFLQTLLGEKQAARLIVEESQKNENCLEEHPLAGLLIYLPPEMLAENGFWDKLKQNHEWQILAKYGHIDDVILMETWTYPAEAAKVLSEYQAEKRIVELKKYLWLVKMPDGPDLLWQEKQFDILFQNRNRLNGWSEEETCKKLCSCPEGCEFLYQAGKSGRDILLSHGCFEPFRKHGEWTFLIRKNVPTPSTGKMERRGIGLRFKENTSTLLPGSRTGRKMADTGRRRSTSSPAASRAIPPVRKKPAPFFAQNGRTPAKRRLRFAHLRR